MKAQDIRKKPTEDLLKQLEEMKEHIRALRFKVANREIKNHQQLRQTKKDLARILTILEERKKT
ncbi:MAG: 50S ribosomal protein L29 [Candidatus Doudnabacteria bacterium]|nr:50S ribosomal protein L29 [bacterium]MDZ4244138.1 50S ribosomal protein L29 [Candidatus Doudnabacteria bacterium]